MTSVGTGSINETKQLVTAKYHLEPGRVSLHRCVWDESQRREGRTGEKNNELLEVRML